MRERAAGDQFDNGSAGDRTGRLPAERRRLIAQQLGQAGRVTVEMLAAQLGVSAMTVRRDLTVLERDGELRRVHGGALPPDLSGHEDAFSARLESEVEAKRRLAEAGVARLEPGASVFVDGSSTAYMAAELIVERDLPVTVLTNSLPVMALFNRNQRRRTELIAIGGTLRELTLCFVGPRAAESASSYLADTALLSCKGVTPQGHVTEPTAVETEVKRVMIAQSREPLLLLDGSKFRQRGLFVVGKVDALASVILADAPEDGLAALRQARVEVEVV